VRRARTGIAARAAIGLAVAGTLLFTACTPIPEDFGQSPTPGSGGSGPPAASASPGVTVEGSTVRIVGLGASTSTAFDLPAGPVKLVITACESNGVMPFITLLDEQGASAGLIVDPEKTVQIAGGNYRVQAQTNPDCVWQVEITPGG
jgi:hypothetical protein